MPRTRLVSLIAALAVVAAACSSGSKATPTAGGAGSAQPETSGQAVVVPSFSAAGGGSCGVQIDGDVTNSWHTDQTMATLLVSYWLSPANRSLLGVGDGTEEILINCQSDSGASISLTSTAGTTAAQLPKAPGTYVIETGGIVGDQKPGEIHAIINLKDSSVWSITESGTFTITSFTPNHLAGTFSMKIGKSGTDLSSIVANATVSGTFDLGCTGDVCS
jgi:hypothetical protein